jgi:IS1 family transposase
MAVDRASGTIVGQAVREHWAWATAQDFVDTLPAVARYCTDGAEVYQEVLWPEKGEHIVSVGKADTYTVESMNANLRTY